MNQPEATITLPRAPWDAPQTPKPAPPRPRDDVWRQSVVAKPVMPMQRPRFDGYAEHINGKTMAEVVRAEQASASFKTRWTGNQAACVTRPAVVRKQNEFESRVIATLTKPMTSAEVSATLPEHHPRTTRSALDRLAAGGVIHKGRPHQHSVILYWRAP